MFDITNLISPGTGKIALKTLEHMGIGKFDDTIVELDRFSNNPAWTKYRVENAQDKISDFWDDHKDDVTDFLDNVGDTISDGWDSLSDTVGDVVEGVGSIFTSLFD